MSNSNKNQVKNYTLNQLKEGIDGPVVVMICRTWDVHNINGRYLSTDFVVSDEKQNVMHCSMKSNVSHCFIDKIQPGVVVSMRYFSVQRKDEYRVIRENDYVIEVNGSTKVRKVCSKVGGFLRHPFQLMEFECIQPTEKKYLIDVIGFVTTVGRSSQPRTGSKNLDFSLINERGRALRVTLWGKLGDQFLNMMSTHSGKYTIILTSLTARYFNGQLGVSSCSSTLILDSDDIPAIVMFKSQISDLGGDESFLPITSTKKQVGTLEELLTVGRDRGKDDPITFHCEAEIINIITKNSWYYPACGGGKCKKGVTRSNGQLWCDSCNKPVEYPKPRFRLEVVVKDVTTQVVVVLWDETANELTKSSAKALLDGLEADDEDDAPALPVALTNTYGSVHVFEIKSHTYYNHAEYESFTCTGVFPVDRSTDSDVQQVSIVSDELAAESSNSKPKARLKRLIKDPELNTPVKSVESKNKMSNIEEYSDVEEIPDEAVHKGIKKRRYIEDDSDLEELPEEVAQKDKKTKDHEE